jgi:hypothetical protein
VQSGCTLSEPISSPFDLLYSSIQDPTRTSLHRESCFFDYHLPRATHCRQIPRVLPSIESLDVVRGSQHKPHVAASGEVITSPPNVLPEGWNRTSHPTVCNRTLPVFFPKASFLFSYRYNCDQRPSYREMCPLI